VARSGLKSGAQGLPGFTLGGSPQANGPEGATRYGDNRLGTFEPDRVRVSGPFRAKLYFRLTQGKPRVNPGLSYFGHFGPRIGKSKLRVASWNVKALYSEPGLRSADFFNSETIGRTNCSNRGK
jgi:hypothetical protein